jgi:hypothetical protein
MAMRAAIVRTLRVNPSRSWDTLTWSGMRRGFSGKVLGEEERAAENIYIKVGFFFFFPFSFSVLFGSIISHESRAEGLTIF